MDVPTFEHWITTLTDTLHLENMLFYREEGKQTDFAVKSPLDTSLWDLKLSSLE